MKPETSARIDRGLVLLLLLWAVTLHGAAFFSAGALWRDEANSIQQARLPSWDSLLRSLEYDSFPILYPALLRVWSSLEWGASDAGLRVLGLSTGLALLVSIYLVAKLLGSRRPAIVLVLLAGNALLVSEGDSVRPYGVSLIFLLWTYGLMGRAAARPSFGVFSAASLASVLSVQAGYTNALLVGALCVCAAGVAAARGERRRLWWYFAPGALAALSLVPYAQVLHRAGAWAAILEHRIDWRQFFGRLVQPQSLPAVVAWLGFIGLAAAAAGRPGNRPRDPSLLRYKVWALLLSLAVQLAFLQAAGMTPFPRYFLPLAILAAFAIEEALEAWNPGLRTAAVTAALLLTAWPAWASVRMRHTNVDEVARLLGQRAGPRDLIVVSPWFLHTSFQRYYRGTCRWITVPDLDRDPMTRYDLVRRAMMEPRGESGAALGLRAALERGGTVWFVSQRPWSNFARVEAPEAPEPPLDPGGDDYVRFRSFWERDIEYRLQACCGPPETPPVFFARVRDEENLILSAWKKKRD